MEAPHQSINIGKELCINSGGVELKSHNGDNSKNYSINNGINNSKFVMDKAQQVFKESIVLTRLLRDMIECIEVQYSKLMMEVSQSNFKLMEVQNLVHNRGNLQ